MYLEIKAEHNSIWIFIERDHNFEINHLKSGIPVNKI
jgi:hypothetical protein